MIKTFDRFLQSLSDDDLKAFAFERSRLLPPYWRAMRMALRVELFRRGLLLDDDWGLALGERRATDSENVEKRPWEPDCTRPHRTAIVGDRGQPFRRRWC